MVRFGWIRSTESLEERFSACLNFFGVADLNEWHDRYRGVQDVVAFRTSGSFESQPGAVAAWIRQGEIEAAKIDTRKWNAAKFEKVLPAIRKLTKKKDPQVFLPELIRLCADCGVAIVIARAPEGCRASGATKFLSADKALVMLSFRHRTDDHFWFTFFHEAGHLLLHGTGALFVEDPNLVTTHEEEEANQFAMDVLVPEEFRTEMLDLPKIPKVITKFAVRVGVSRGIIVGQLQHHGRIAHKDLNFMKARYAWATP
jgi:Zn-dependent peptidase ImmA (M78 family)